MPAMKPGSGGPYSKLSELRSEKRRLEQRIENGPPKRGLKRQLENLKDELKSANAVVRALRKKSNPA